MNAETLPAVNHSPLQHYRALLEIADAISAHNDLLSLLKDLSERLKLVIDFDAANVVLYDQSSNKMRLHGFVSDIQTEISLISELSVEEAPAGWVWQNQKPLLMTDLDAYENRYPQIIAELRRHGIKTVFVLPLTSLNNRLGALGFGSTRENAWSTDGQEFLQLIAKLVAVAVEGVVNYENAVTVQEEIRRERDRISLSLEINNAMASHLDLRELVKTISASLRGIMPHDSAGIALYDVKLDQLREYTNVTYKHLDAFREGDTIPLAGTPAGQVFISGQPLLIKNPDPTKYPADHYSQNPIEDAPKSACLAPLISHGRKLGIVGVSRTTVNGFTEQHLELLNQIAGQIALAVENALNFQRAHKAEQELALKLEHLRLLLEINNAVVSKLDLRELLRVISTSLRGVLQHAIVGIALHDSETGQLRAYTMESPDNLSFIKEGQIIPLEGSPGGLAFTTGQPIFVSQIDKKNFSDEINKLIEDAGLKSGCNIPLIVHGRKLGVLGLASFQEGAFTEENKDLLCRIADQIAIAVDNSLNFERAQAAEKKAKLQSERLQLMLEINNAVVSELSLLDLARVTSSRLREALRHDVTGISLYDPEINQFRAYLFDLPDNMPPIEQGTLMPLEGSVGGQAFMTGQPVFMSRPDPERLSSEFDKRLTDAGIMSGGVVPLIAHDKKLGFLGVGSFRENAFSESDQELLCHIANQIAIAVENALAFREIESLKNKLTSEKLYLEDEIRTQHNFEELIGESQIFKRILKQVETVAPTDSTVLICGETGTGKELIARAIHDLSQRRERTLVKINCAAIPTGLLESEIFGHEKGAFTGAISQRAGRFELANRGTLFLDEVGDIPLELQPKLLRVLQEQEFERLGSTRTQKVDVRLIAATNCDLEQMVADRKYRSDLFYRLNVFPITIPPLRQRREDIPALTRFFTQKYARRLKKQITAIPAEVMSALTNYHWPGNVRELEHFIERAVILTRGGNLEVSLNELKSSQPIAATELTTLHEAERDHILRTLEETNWVVGGPQGAAARLGMKRTTLQSKMQKLGINRQS